MRYKPDLCGLNRIYRQVGAL
uniref:Uncharacterized protein n=1 Tax=Anguilla anguilla TaxID=7936 RepID=A0A0E9VJH7_ANGAN